MMNHTNNIDPSESIRLEMVHTEETFIGHLRFLIQEYKEPLLRHAHMNNDDGKLLTLSEIETVFGNVEQLLDLSNELLENLQAKNAVCECTSTGILIRGHRLS